MRIIAGALGGRLIKAPKGLTARPSGERLREALFSILGECVEGARVLDAFAGSGALGFEALSRGAAQCVFIDADAQCVGTLEANVAALGVGDAAVVRRGDVLGLLPELGAFDLIFLDPPYALALAEPALRLINQYRLLSEGGVIVLETDKRRDITPPSGLEVYDERVYGTAKIRLLRAKGT